MATEPEDKKKEEKYKKEEKMQEKQPEKNKVHSPMQEKQSKKDKAKEKGGACCGFFCGVLIIVALALDRITFPIGDESVWCGFEIVHTDDGSVGITYKDISDACTDISDEVDDCNACCDPYIEQMLAGYAWIILNIVAALACIGAAIAVVLGKGKKFAKFGYLIAGICLLVAIVWFCFGSPLCYDYDSTLGYSMIIDIIAMIFLFMAIYCVSGKIMGICSSNMEKSMCNSCYGAKGTTSRTTRTLSCDCCGANDCCAGCRGETTTVTTFVNCKTCKGRGYLWVPKQPKENVDR